MILYIGALPNVTETPNKILLDSYPNIHFVHLNISKILPEISKEDFELQKKIMKQSKWPFVHLSDLYRILILLNLGGTYLDTDTVTLRHFSDNITNFVVAKKTGGISKSQSLVILIGHV